MNDRGGGLKITDIKGIKLDSVGSVDSVVSEESIMEVVDRMPAEDKKILQKTWTIVSRDMKEVGGQIFEMIFEQSPDTKTLFPFTKSHSHGRHEKISTDIQFHGLRFMQIIESAIGQIDHIKDLEPLLDNLGRRHGKLVEKTAFKTHHWGTFVECTLFHFRLLISQDSYLSSDISKIDKAIILWRILLKSIIKRMKIGLAQDLKNRRHHREFKINSNLQTETDDKHKKSSKYSSSMRDSKSSVDSTGSNSVF